MWPPIGLGTAANDDFRACKATVETAVELGYRHVDTAQFYGNEAAVGAGIRAADVPRDEVIIATKIWRAGLGFTDIHRATHESLDRLGVDRIDLLYVHWPTEKYAPGETLAAFEDLLNDGTIGGAGVCNFTAEQFATACDHLGNDLVAHQFELHPLFQQEELVERTRCRDVHVVAYCPLARGRVTDHSVLQSIGRKHGLSAPQVALAWLSDLDGVIPIPKSTCETHLRENLQAVEVSLDPEDHASIGTIDETGRLVDPDLAPWNDQ